MSADAADGASPDSSPAPAGTVVSTIDTVVVGPDTVTDPDGSGSCESVPQATSRNTRTPTAAVTYLIGVRPIGLSPCPRGGIRMRP